MTTTDPAAIASSATPARVKPRLRGVSHEAAFYASLGASAVLVALARTPAARVAAVVYGASMVTMFGISALYHRPTWSPGPRALLRRIDHAGIFVFIAGS